MMIIKKIRCRHFRNITEVELELGPGLNIFLGNNGQGKSNLLEAIYMFVVGKSYRAGKDSETIQWEQSHLELNLALEKKTVNYSLSLWLDEKKKTIAVDGLTKKRIADLLGYLNAVSFFPPDLNLITGGPSQRRDFLDMEISQVIPRYYRLCQDYKKVVRQRNNLLRDSYKPAYTSALLQSWTEKLIELGSDIVVKRLETLYKLNILARLGQRQLTGEQENLQLAYQSSLGFTETTAKFAKVDKDKIVAQFKKQLLAEQQKELRLRQTLIGPHRDDIVFYVNGRNIKKYGSQGQQRTTVLALKLAELQFMRSETSELPVLLLDDVLSELDQRRRNYLLHTVTKNSQALVTATDMSFFSPEILQHAVIFKVENGRIWRE